MAAPTRSHAIPEGSPAIVADGLSIRFNKFRKRQLFIREILSTGKNTVPDKSWFWALDDVSFTINSGEAVGVVGENGSGKSTLLKLMAGVLLPDAGTVAVNGGVAPLIEITGGFVNELTGRENITTVAALHGLRKAEVAEKFEDIVEFAGVREFLDTPYRHYSSGMKVRLAFGVMAHLDEPIIMVDEVLAVGDAKFRAKCHDRIETLLSEGRTLFLVSHSANDIKRFCSRALFLEKGRLVMDGPADEVMKRYERS